MGSPMKQDAAISMSQYEKGESHASDHQRKNRRCLIIAGVIALLIVITVAIVVPVVLTQKSSDSSGEEDNKCGPFSYPGVNISQLTPRIISHIKTCPLEGDCWTGTQCYECFKLSEWKVGNINDIPVCCPQCELSGLSISNSRCNCRHNG